MIAKSGGCGQAAALISSIYLLGFVWLLPKTKGKALPDKL
jgi:hypothetical protein